MSDHRRGHLRQWRALLGLGALGALVGRPDAAQAQVASPPARPKSPAPRRLAVVLGGGSARGFAHIGVIKALEAHGIQPDLIVGSSAGALVGAFWAGGFSGAEMEALAQQVRDQDVIDLVAGTPQGRRGLVSGQALQSFVNTGLRGRSLQGLITPFVAVATKYPSGELQAFRQGDAGFAVRASCSIPGIFLPASRDGQEYLDGGLISPIPVQTARSLGATMVVAVDVGADDAHQGPKPGGGGMYELILRSFEIMGQSLRRHEGSQADVLIRPEVGRISSTDFASRKALIDAGLKAGQLLAPVIAAKLKQR